jgi:hypothetical protein
LHLTVADGAKEMVAQRSIGRKKLIKPDLSVYRGYPLVSTVYP